MNKSHAEKDAELPAWGPPEDVWLKAVPIWCGASHEELEERRGEEYASAFAAGFENGIIQSMLTPEWAQGFLWKLRNYYLTTHTLQDLEDWNECAERTARAIPVTNAYVTRTMQAKKSLRFHASEAFSTEGGN